jgi:hypothetical protein
MRITMGVITRNAAARNALNPAALADNEVDIFQERQIPLVSTRN